MFKLSGYCKIINSKVLDFTAFLVAALQFKEIVLMAECAAICCCTTIC